jgi:hypothetical protein
MIRWAAFALVALMTACTHDSAGDDPAVVRPTTPTVTSAVATEYFVGRPDSIDTAAGSVLWTVTCGRKTGQRIATAVGAATFEVESNPTDPAAGHVRDESFADWAAYDAHRQEWVVSAGGGQARSVRSLRAPSDHDPCAN